MLGVSENRSTILAITLSKWWGQPCVNQIGSFAEYNLIKNLNLNIYLLAFLESPHYTFTQTIVIL